MKRRELIVAAAASAGLALPGVSVGQGAWPSRPVRIINPYSPGGTSDVIVRFLAAGMERAFGQPFVVDNRPGAGGAVGTAAAAAAAPDGYTLLVTNTGPLSVSVHMKPAPAYDPSRSFQYVTMFGGAPILCAVRGNGPISNMAEYRAAAARSREAVTFSSSGVGSIGHLTGLLWAREAGVEMLHVPFRGAPEAEASILGGSVDSLWNTVGAHTGGVVGGSLRGLAVTSEGRISSVPNVPTIVESGFPGAVVSNWFLLAAPAGVPAEVVTKLRSHLGQAMDTPAAQERWAASGLVRLGDPAPDQIASFVLAEGERWAPVVRAAGV